MVQRRGLGNVLLLRLHGRFVRPIHVTTTIDGLGRFTAYFHVGQTHVLESWFLGPSDNVRPEHPTENPEYDGDGNEYRRVARVTNQPECFQYGEYGNHDERGCVLLQSNHCIGIRNRRCDEGREQIGKGIRIRQEGEWNFGKGFYAGSVNGDDSEIHGVASKVLAGLKVPHTKREKLAGDATCDGGQHQSY